MAKTSIIVEDNKQINRVNTHQRSVAAARTRCSAGSCAHSALCCPGGTNIHRSFPHSLISCSV